MTFDEVAEFQLVHDDLIERLKKSNQALGLTISQSLIDETRDIAEKVLLPGAFAVLTHGDICPDNVFDHPSKAKDLQLIDFEWSFVRSALLDGTYLRMSFPTCWCCRRLLRPATRWRRHQMIKNSEPFILSSNNILNNQFKDN